MTCSMSQQVRHRNNPSIHWQMKEFLKCELNVIHLPKRNSAFCENMDKLKSFMLSEVSQTKTHTVCFHLYVES